MIFTGLCGSPWTVRSLKDGHKNLLEDSPLAEGLAEAFGYYRDNYELFSHPAENTVKLLYVPDNAMCMMDTGMDNIRNTVEELTTKAVPFSMVAEKDLDSLTAGEILILPELLYTPEALLEAIRRAANRGVKILVIGKLGRYYADGKERGHSHWIFTMGEKDGFYYTDADFVPTLRNLNAENEITLDATGILLETCRADNGDLILHLLNAANDRVIEKLTVTLPRQVTKATCISLENAEIAEINGNQIVLKNLQTTATVTIR
jgi:hypothetical protein